MAAGLVVVLGKRDDELPHLLHERRNQEAERDDEHREADQVAQTDRQAALHAHAARERPQARGA